MLIITIPSPARQVPNASPFKIIAAGLMFIPVLMVFGITTLIRAIKTNPKVAKGIGEDIPGKLDVKGSPLLGQILPSLLEVMFGGIDKVLATAGMISKCFKMYFLSPILFRPMPHQQFMYSIN